MTQAMLRSGNVTAAETLFQSLAPWENKLPDRQHLAGRTGAAWIRTRAAPQNLKAKTERELLKTISIALCLMSLAGCSSVIPKVNPSLIVIDNTGDPPPPRPTPTPTPAPTLVADQVFVNVAQTWEFVSQCRNLNSDGSRGPLVEAHTWVNVIPVDPTHSIWHYAKDQPCAYWMPDGIDAELYFFLERVSSGAWYSTGGHIIAPFGYPWDATHTPQDFTYTLAIDPTRPRPYLIIPALSNDTPIVMSTTFLDTQGPNTPWVTISLTVPANTPVYAGWAMQSGQQEGFCPVCADEAWLFAANGMGMVQITVNNTGSGYLATPIVLRRIMYFIKTN